ncbi:MAG: class I SAM-dependent methyltransferase [Defluviitaleaceae bacterium]|nr:class I SAM-dependent methyltransferase [Defluviitaleaceae bacterium]
MRLSTLLNCVGRCKVLADIGTDHAYLPISAMREGICKTAIACDINEGPLEMAKKNIAEAGFSDFIETRLGDGLLPLNDDVVDCIVISGMGGMKIIEILAVKSTSARLVLQPQHDLEELRRFLHENMYNILEEKLAFERGRFYEIIVAQNAEKISLYTDAEYYHGRMSDPHFLPYLREKHRKIMGYIHSAAIDSKDHKRLKWLEEGMNKHGDSTVGNRKI